MIKKKYALEHGLSLHDLLTREDILYIVEDENGNEELDQIVLEAVEEAALQVKQMREMEGNALEKDVSSHLHTLHHLVIKLEKLAPNVVSSTKINY